jgi:hypothetical protein
MELPLDPGLALEGLPFGSSKIAVRAAFESAPQEFERSQASEGGDYWPDLGIFAYTTMAESWRQ